MSDKEKMNKRINRICSGIRPKSHKRAITLNVVIDEYCERNNVDKSDLLKDLTPKRLKEICYEVGNYKSDRLKWLIGLSNRTIKDYIKTIKYFHYN